MTQTQADRRRVRRSESSEDDVARGLNKYKIRLDRLLVERGYFDTRSKAASAVMAGEVSLVGLTSKVKPGLAVDHSVEIELKESRRFVSRGGIKLANALDHFGLDVSGLNCIDIGASTGGFTDCLLQHGAEHVVAVDVAYGELNWRLRNDPRVTVIERKNARQLEADELPFKPQLVVVDLSFISLQKVLPAVTQAAAEDFRCLALIKPQFEVGRGLVGSGGVVRDPELRRSALITVGESVVGLGYPVEGYCFSGLPGPAGNRESFTLFGPGCNSVGDLAAAVTVAEPE